MAATTRSRYSRIWSAAREMGIGSDEVHDIVARETGEDSLKALDDRQVEQIGNLLWDMAKGRKPQPDRKKRTCDGGNPATGRQRCKIYMLALDLGWSEDDINAFSQKHYGITRHEWLSPKQCSDMIQAMDAMEKRQRGKKQAAGGG